MNIGEIIGNILVNLMTKEAEKIGIMAQKV